MAAATDIKVQRKVRDGWYVYTSAQVPGLYIASKDDRAAYEDLAPAIEKLLELNKGISCKVVPKLGSVSV